MSTTKTLFRAPDESLPLALLRRNQDDFGLHTLDLCRPPSRFWPNGDRSAPVRINVDMRKVDALATPAELLGRLPEGETWIRFSRRAIARTQAWFLVCEDRQRRLDAQPVATLAHQASLVEHLLQEVNLPRVLVADEVGLGKTVEAGLFLRELIARQPSLRVLYLAPARLVANVRKEFERLGLNFRSWVADAERDAKLEVDRRIIASIHRAAHEKHFDTLMRTPPWDVIVVDECHHLSDWGKGGGQPVVKYRLVNDLVKRMPPTGRLLLMSGTPHQGSPVRFENLLKLLRRDGEPETALAGRVIYRTKDDVRDWDGNPLFPRRQVNDPIVLDLGDELRRWLENIHQFFEESAAGGGQARRRAAGWRCGQALQWATSSIQAGLGYLVRQAMRAGWKLENPKLCTALLALRPYRDGSPTESAESLYARLAREVGRQAEEGDVEDIEDDAPDERSSTWRPDPTQLGEVIDEGVGLLRRFADGKWERIHERILKNVGDEKVVLFAQPIETVTALAGYLERMTGRRPARIVGNQSESERQREIDAFWRDDGPQFLVSSRAGGEGYNLQIARRIIHVDVPWNPMELEQRVGRVHRFLSKRTILVDTVVVKDSREVDAYHIAREKLREISRTLVPEDRFEALFSRVMALVAPDEIQDILGERPTGPFSDEERQRMSTLVVQGFDRWQQFDTRYKEREQTIRSLDPGQAQWEDLSRFVRDSMGAKAAEGFSALRFRWNDDEVVESSEAATVVDLDGKAFACGDYGGMPITGADGKKAAQLGLNVETVAQALRKHAFPDALTGAAHVRWPDSVPLPRPGLQRPFGVLIFARVSVRSEQGSWIDAGSNLLVWTVDGSGQLSPVERDVEGATIRALAQATVRIEPEAAPDLIRHLEAAERQLLTEARRPTETDRDQRVVHTVTPLLAAVVS